mgnify:CR=1 FL=1
MKPGPPEFVHRRSPNVVSVGDTFWLGLVLWRITRVAPIIEFEMAGTE